MPDDLLEAPAASADATDTAAPAEPAAKDAPASKDAPVADKAPPAKTTEKPATSAKVETEDDDPLDIDDSEEGAKPAAGWPEDWRERMAGGDEKLLKELKRFTTIDNWAKSQRALRQKLSSGEYKRATLPEDATEAEKAEWRKENGIPDKPEDYGIPEVKGHEWSDADKAIANQFLTDLHAVGTPKPIAQAALTWYAKFQSQQLEARAEMDRQAATEREDALRAEWGPGEYRPHVNLAKTMFNDDAFIPAPLRQALAEARTADGRRVTHMPEFIMFLAQAGLERKGSAGLITGEQGARLNSRMDEIKKVRETDIDRYYAEKMDVELLELTEKIGQGRTR